MQRSHTPAQSRYHRHARIRAVMQGTADRPRLVVFRSLKHISAQLVDDRHGRTLVSVADLKTAKGTKAERAAVVGRQLAELALAKKISRVVFDRGGYKFHGRVKALADAARQAGLIF